jgi:hypothetical protein
MRSLLTAFATTVALVAAASPAGAATVTGTVHRDEDSVPTGTMQFRAGPGVANRVTVTPEKEGRYVGSTFLIIERAERLKASGACDQVNGHTARCPITESDNAVEISLGGRADRVAVERVCRGRYYCGVGVLARGGRGDDVLLGGGEFYGDGGDDVLRGAPNGRGWDRFHGGPGGDLMVGRGPAGNNALGDIFYDDETDAQATRDVIRGGEDARAMLDYSMRERNLSLDLHDSRLGPEGDRVSGVRSLVTGAGDDELIGTGGTNRFGGGPGDDLLDGRGGGDVLGGGADDDTLLGGTGRDRLEEIYFSDVRSSDTPLGSDRFVGGPGPDEVGSVDTDEPDGEVFADDVQCDPGDLPVVSDPTDLLRDCFEMAAWGAGLPRFTMRVVPELTEEGAVFTLRCAPTEFDDSSQPRCRGELVLTSDGGAEFGRQGFDFGSEDPLFWPEVTVTVPLSDAGRAAIEANEVIGVRVNAFSDDGFTFPPAGYRAQLGAG